MGRVLVLVIISFIITSCANGTPKFQSDQAFMFLEDQCKIGPRYPGSDEITSTNNKIFFVITNRVEYSAVNPWYFLVVSKSDEFDMNLTTSGEMATYTATMSVTMEEGWSVEDLHAIAIVQSFDGKQILQAAQVKYSGTEVPDEPLPPVNVELRQNYPNPFNPSTTISYSLNKDANVILEIFNQKGQKIKKLVKERQNTGIHSEVWNGKDNRGKNVPSGLYFYKLTVDIPDGGKYVSVKKMILLK